MQPHREECPACNADGELAPTGEGIYDYANRLGLSAADLPPAEHRAWCIPCRGTCLADTECEGCGAPVAREDINEDALKDADVLVHRCCDTNNAFFDANPAPAPRGENYWGSTDVAGWR